MKNKWLLRLLVFFAAGIVLQFFAGKILKGDVFSFARITIHEIHSTPKIDTVFIGDSHVYREFNPEILDSKLNESTFIAATGSQGIDGSYALLRETFYYHPELKRVFLDPDYIHNPKYPFKERNHLPPVYAISDNLKNQKIKFDYLIHATSPQYWLNSYLTFGKNKVTPRPYDVKNTVKSYFNGDYWRYIYPVYETEQYCGKGFIPSTEANPENQIFLGWTPEDFIENEVTKDWSDNFNKICSFCKKNNLELIVFTSPETDFCVKSHEHFQEYDDYLSKITKSYGFNYFDFNLAKKEYLPLTNQDFMNTDHLNKSGSTIFSDFICDFILSDYDTEKYFHNTLKEKQLLLENKVLGFTDISDPDFIDITPVAFLSDSCSITYAYIFTSEDGNSEILEQNTSKTKLQLPDGKKGTLKVNYYINDELNGSFEKEINTLWNK